MSYRTISPQKLSPHVGAELPDIDLSRPLPPDQIAEINHAVAAFGVVVLRDQTLTPAQHIAAARQFGAININRFFTPVPGHPEIAEVRKEPAHRANVGGLWHSDHSYDQSPAKASLLYARTLPAVGGETLYSSNFAAYDCLSAGLKQTLEGLNAIHSSRHVFGHGSRAHTTSDLGDRLHNPDLATQDAIHPVVISHPLTGRKALYVNPNFTLRIDGWTAEESRPLLEFLYAHAVRPEFLFSLSWRPGTLAFWDNRSTLHFAVNNYAGEARLLHRITLEGETLGRAA